MFHYVSVTLKSVYYCYFCCSICKVRWYKIRYFYLLLNIYLLPICIITIFAK